MARVVVPGVPHHVTQRGNRRQQVFFCENDYGTYLRLLEKYCRRANVRVWAYCLMPNHVHLVMIPTTYEGLHLSLAEAHRKYTLQINRRNNWTGYLWQGRFASFPMDDRHLISAVRYIELNPVRAGLCKHAEDWAWSSARAHISGANDALVSVSPMLCMVSDWSRFLTTHEEEHQYELIRKHSRTGRPLGSDKFITDLESITGRALKLKRVGRKPNAGNKQD
jgi:putative transposase